MKPLPGMLSRHFDYSIEGLARSQEIQAMMTSPDFVRARTRDEKKQCLVKWLRTRRLEKGYAVVEIDRKHRAFTDQAAAAYASWDERQAETILQRAGRKAG